MNMIKFTFYAVGLLVLAGCGPATTVVSGTVTQNGTGLKDIVVLLQPISDQAVSQSSAYGKTDAQGRFTLSRLEGKKRGVIPGRYAVFVNWNDPVPKTEYETPATCPYNIPTEAKTGNYQYTVGNEGKQRLDLELNDYPVSE